MKKVLKVFMFVIIGFLSLIILLTVIAKLAQDKIADLTLEYVSEIIESPVTIENVSFHLLHKFPLATIELNGVNLGSPTSTYNTDSTLSDTLIYIDKIYLSVKSKALLDNEIDIIKIEIAGADFNYLIDEHGATNFDFLMDTTTVVEEPDTIPSAPLNLVLKEFSLKNITLNYSDNSTQTEAEIFIPKIKIKAKAKNDKYSASIKGNVKLSNCSFEETNLYLMSQTEAKFDLNYINDSASIVDFTLITDGAQINVTGHAIVKDTIYTDLAIKGTDINLGELIKYAPKEMLDEYGLLKVMGVINLDATVKGDVTDTDIPQVKLNISMKDGIVSTADYPEIKNISFSGKVTNGLLRSNKSTSIDFNSFHVETAHSNFNFAFSVLDIDHPKYKFKTDMDINFSDFKQLIPDTLLKSINGNLHVNFSTKGVLPNKIGDDFTDYALERSALDLNFKNININVDDTLLVKNFNAQFNYIPKRIKINGLGVKVPSYDVDLKNSHLDAIITGKTTDLKTLGVDVRSYKFQTGSNIIEGNATIYNIDAPEYTMNTSIHLKLLELMPFVPDSMINSMVGLFDAEIHSHGKINMDSIDQQSMALVFANSRFAFKATDITLDMVDEASSVERFSMNFAMANDIINIDNVYGKYSGLEFWMDSTEILNVYDAIILENRDSQLIVQTNVRLGDITNEFLYPYMYPDTTNIVGETSDVENKTQEPVVPQQSDSLNNDVEALDNNNEENITGGDSEEAEVVHLLPDFKELGVPHFLVRGKFSVDKVEYEKNVLDDMSMKFRFADSIYVIDEMKFNMCGGDLNTSILFDARKWDKPKFDMKNITNNFDLKKLLKDNNNFGDTALTYEKVSGTLSSDINIRMFFIGDSVPTNKIRVKGGFVLEDGYIYDYQPLVELSTSMGGLKELNKLDFNTLKTSIFMFKNKVYIPKTDIVSSALDLSASAMYNMNDDYESHIVLHLGDVVTGKSSKLMKEQEKQNKKDGGTVDRNGLNLVAMDVDGKAKYGFDNEKLKRKFNNKLNMQQGFLNLLFNPMLVNFSTEFDRTKRNREILEKYEKDKKAE